MSEVKNYAWHYEQSREMFAKFVINSKNNPEREDWIQYHDMLGTCDMMNQVEEFRYAMEAYEYDAEQIKIIWNPDLGHCVKIKWEHPGWWADDVLHHYYCVMLPLRNIELFEPSKLHSA